MRKVPFIDSTGLHNLENKCNHIDLALTRAKAIVGDK